MTTVTSTSDKEYGDLMRCLLFFRELYSSEEEFKRFVVESLQTFLYDLRDFEVYISISPESLRGAPPDTGDLYK